MDKKYVFISYAHKDSGKVISIIQAMKDSGIALWYDEGIEAGTEWPEYIGEKISDASVFISFMSPSAAASVNCRNEINYALSLGKEMLVVYLEPTNLSAGMQLQLGSIQAMFYDRSKNQAEFIDNLLRARILKDIMSGKAPTKKRVTASGTPKPAKNTCESSLIAQVRSISSTIENDRSPAGKYSNVMSMKNLKSICFHVYFNKRFETEKNVTLLMIIYDQDGHVVCDEKYGCKVLPTYDSISVVWKAGSNNGCLLNEGEYRAEFVLENTGVYTYNFRMTSDNVREGIKTTIGRKLAEIEDSFGIPRYSLTYASWIAIAILITVGGNLILSKIWPGWWDSFKEFLTTPATEWFK